MYRFCRLCRVSHVRKVHERLEQKSFESATHEALQDFELNRCVLITI